MFCNNCGMELENDALFCTNCGAKVVSGSAAVDDDDKTVLLDEMGNPAVDTAEAEEAADAGEAVFETAGETGGAEAGEKTEAAAGEVAVEEDSEAAAVEEDSETAAKETAKEDEKAFEEKTGEAPGMAGAEKIETVEMSPTGAVETGTAMLIPSEMEQRRFCPNCGTQNGSGDLFCRECGFFFGNVEEKMNAAAAQTKKKKGGIVGKLAIAAAIIAVVGLCIVLVPRILGGLAPKSEEQDFVMYVKDNELTMAKKNKYEPVVIGDRMYGDWSSITNGYNYGDSLVTYSPDYKYVYYPQRTDADGCDLYYRQLGGKKEGVKIDSQVVTYEVIDQDRLVYIKDREDYKLYLYRDGESERIASDVENMLVSEDGKYVLWQSDGKLYVQDTALKADRVKLVSDVSVVYGISEDFSRIVYQKNDNLYVMKGMEEAEKIASDIEDVYVYDIDHSLKIYYLKEGNEESVSYYDLIDDDLFSQDQQMAEPRIEDYQRVTYKDSFWGMQETVEVDDAYYEEVDKYRQKQERDSLRGRLQTYMINLFEQDFYYYDEAVGDSERVLTASMVSGDFAYGSIGADTALLYVQNLDLEETEKPKFSELATIAFDEMQQKIVKAMQEGRQLLYLENGELYEIADYEGEENYPEIWADEKNHMLYLIYYRTSYNELYGFDYKQPDASLELITDELGYVVSYDMGEICYVNEDDELYYGETMVDEEIGMCQVYDNTLLYLTDMDKNHEEGTLHLFRGRESTKLADDVAAGSYVMFDADKVAFLTDYNYRKYYGDLYVYDGKKTSKVDTDVTKIIN